MSYSDIAGHRAMVFDSIRNAAYARAIAKVVTADSVVLDLGAGTGILGLLAAQAGARRVYLVEPQPVIQLASEFAAANGLSDRIVVFQGRIEEVELPELVDVIISVFTGNLLYSEDLLPSLFHARERYLKPGGVLVPDLAELCCAPWHLPELHEERVARWSTPAGSLDVSAARRLAANSLVELSRDELAGVALAEGLQLCQVDLTSATVAECWGEARWQLAADGICHGFLCWIRIALCGEWLSTDPACPELHWMNVVLPVDPPLALQAGDHLSLRVQRPERGEWSWQVRCTAGQRVHSTFFSRIPSHSVLARIELAHRPLLERKGLAARHVLQLMDGMHTNAALAELVLAQFPELFANLEGAQKFVQSLALQFDEQQPAATADNQPVTIESFS